MEITKNTDKLCLKNIHDLLGMSFYVPAYQRGYRWGAGQVKALLDDIWDFTLNKSTTFYCLQPIVVTRGNNSWPVVDGQQRLTTLFLLISVIRDLTENEDCLKTCKEIIFQKKNLFTNN